jgi:Methyl-accepting chemotaxis protein
MEAISQNEVINAFNLLIPYLKIFFDNEASFAVTDREKFLHNVRNDGENFDGTPLSPTGAATRAIKNGVPVIDYFPSMALKSYSIPVKGRDGNVDGCIIVGKSLKKREELLELSKNLSTALKDISEVTNDFSTKLQSVVEMNAETAKKIDEAHDNASSTDKIFTFINQVTSQTDLLGINASIEATRAGAEGRGFKVIAQEIRKLSDTNRESVNRIYTMLNAINKSVDDICTMTTRTQEITATYSTAFAEIAESVEKLSANAQLLETMADKV